MAGRTARKAGARHKVVAHPAEKGFDNTNCADTDFINHTNADFTNHSDTDSDHAPNTAFVNSTSDLADHMAQVLTGKKKLAPTPEFLDSEAKIKKAWAEGWRGVEKREFREREDLFLRSVLKVAICGDRHDSVLVDRLDELAAAEGYTVG